MVMPVSTGTGAVTVTTALDCLVGSAAAVAMMVALLTATPVTTPVWLTIAIWELDDDQFTATLDVPLTVAVSCVVRPTSTEAVSGLMVMLTLRPPDVGPAPSLQPQTNTAAIAHALTPRRIVLIPGFISASAYLRRRVT